MAEPPVGSGLPPARTRLTLRRLSGLDRSGPPPQTLAGAPLNPWTLPNAIGYARLALLPVFLALAFGSDDGRDTTAAILFAVIAGGDYLDGIAARVTGQYSRLGTLMDPLIDRLLVLSGVAVCWHFDLLPRWALVLLAARELLMVALVRWALRHGLELRINWLGRLGVWPTMAAPGLAMISADALALGSLYCGLVLVLAATGVYVHDGLVQLRAGRKGSS